MAAAGTVTSNIIAHDVTPQMSARRSSASPRAESRSFRSAAVIERPESSAVARSAAVAASRPRVASIIGITATSCATAAHTEALLQTKIDEQLRPEQAAERRRREDLAHAGDPTYL